MEKTKLICNKFLGINRCNATYSSNVITATDMQNVELYATEVNSGIGIRTMKGNIAICSSIPQDETVINIFESVQRGDTLFYVHTESQTEGKIYLFSVQSNTLSLKVEGLSLTGQSCGTDVAQGWSDLFVFSNGEEILSIENGHYNSDAELDEVVMMNLEDAEGIHIKGMGLVVFAGRLWIFSGQKLWFSVQENIYDFSASSAELSTSSGYIEFVKEITAIYPYLGTLAVFHSNSSCLVTTDNEGNFSKTMDFPGGCAGYNSLVFHGTELYFYDHTKKGIFSFVQVVNGDKTLGSNIAIDIQEELFTIPSNALNKIKTASVVTADKNEVWMLIPSDDNDYSLVLIYDYIRKSWIKRKCQKINCMATINGVLYSAGNKIFEEYTSNTFNEEFIESYYKCTPLNLGVENSLKILSYPPKVSLDMSFNNSFYVEYTKNYDSFTTKTRHIKAKSLKNSLYFDIGHWDVDYYPIKDINSVKKLPASYFKTLQMSFCTKYYGDDFCIKNIEFGKIKYKSV